MTSPGWKLLVANNPLPYNKIDSIVYIYQIWRLNQTSTYLYRQPIGAYYRIYIYVIFHVKHHLIQNKTKNYRYEVFTQLNPSFLTSFKSEHEPDQLSASLRAKKLLNICKMSHQPTTLL